MTTSKELCPDDSFFLTHSTCLNPVADIDQRRLMNGLIDAGDCYRVSVPHLRDWYPTNVKWTNFPSLTYPDFKLPTRLLENLENTGGDVIRRRLRGQEVLPFIDIWPNDSMPVDSNWSDYRDILRAVVSAFQKHYCPNAEVMFCTKWFEHEISPTRLDRADLDAWWERAGGNLHLDRNYAFNSNAILKPIFTPFIPDCDLFFGRGINLFWERVFLKAERLNKKFKSSGRSDLFEKPMYLQFLYETSVANDIDMKNLAELVADVEVVNGRMDLSGFDFGESIRNGMWVGTGKYSPITLEYLLPKILPMLVGYMFLIPDVRLRTVEFSEFAEEILKHLHKTNRDPDLPLRFLTPHSYLISAGEIARIDECLGRFFRKAKTGVNRCRVYYSDFAIPDPVFALDEY